ncbi:MAG TPA: hypothetical protein V6D15_15985 [Oculatellaceae cyanobacterium]|jgi:hypothetical protein
MLSFLSSKQFGNFLKITLEVCGYIVSLIMLVLGLIALFHGGIFLGMRAIVAALLFCPFVKISTFWQFLLGTIIVVFTL